ncbi:MAG: sodium:dicarboxylate symporter [Planctomycetes bacterium RBG_16_64_10]|nr:MAG: sodium:dicarboxylate symporter [Planctomycetes bacterium RBG_16_64_10]
MTPDPFSRSNGAARRKLPLHTQILLGLIAGAILGVGSHMAFAVPAAAPAAEQVDGDANGLDDRLDWLALQVADPLGRIFLRLVLMVVLPLVFSALALAVFELGDLRQLGSIGLRTLLLTLLLSGVAVMIGVSLVNAVRPGARLSPEKRDMLAAQYAGSAAESLAKSRQAKSLKDTLLDIIPENPLQEMTGALDGSSKGNGILAVMFFALVFGAATARVGAAGKTVVGLLEGVYAVSMQVIEWAMRLAPFGVACLIFAMTARLGGAVFVTLGWFLATVLLGFALQLGVVYPALLVVLGRRRPWSFFRAAQEAMLTAFATSSSNATLPVSLRVARERLGLPPAISRFVLTVGATGNQNGTALYEGVVVLFLAQVFGVDLSIGQQVMVVLLSVLSGVGTAGVPGGSIPMIVLVLQSIGVPGESVAIILGIDRILDMCRTVLNVTGDLALAACVARPEPADAHR